MDEKLYHIAAARDWEAARRQGYYAPPSLEAEGFIHCSRRDQVLAVAATFYAGRRDLVLLRIDPARLGAELRWEPPAGGPPQGLTAEDRFPHLYGALNLDAVEAVLPFQPAADGTFSWPEAA